MRTLTPLWRGILLVALAAVLAACGRAAEPQATEAGITPGSTAGATDIVLTKSPDCTCCGGHQAYLERHGFRVHMKLTDDIAAIKDEHGIPAEMRSCHTSTIGRYFVEGHVPTGAIDKLLAERPDVDGIALPGMPAGSPGMGGQLEGRLVVYAIDDGAVVGEFGRF